MKTIEVNEKCICCGICTQKTNLLVEDATGKAKPAAKCVIKEKELAVIEAIVAECPVNALKIVTKHEGSKLDAATLKKLPNVLKMKLEAVPKLTVKREDVKMESKKYSIDYPSPNGQYRYNYSSESKAMRAAIEEFDRIAYSQYRRIILDTFVQYKEDKLKKYYTFGKGSFWSEGNERFKKSISRIC